ncbi:MAG: hypothetical protein RL846_37355, partial [Deltaproteobacteria bacterium]
ANLQGYTFRTFFSWASEHTATNTSIIRKSIDRAQKRLKERRKVDFIRDEATRDRAGAVDIVGSLLEKIAMADVVVADITFASRGRPPNPNVLWELGYAFGHRGQDRIITVFNEHYGSVSRLPFDIRNLRHLIYRKSRFGSRDKAVDELANGLYLALKAVVDKRLEREVEGFSRDLALLHSIKSIPQSHRSLKLLGIEKELLLSRLDVAPELPVSLTTGAGAPMALLRNLIAAHVNGAFSDKEAMLLSSHAAETIARLRPYLLTGRRERALRSLEDAQSILYGASVLAAQQETRLDEQSLEGLRRQARSFSISILEIIGLPTDFLGIDEANELRRCAVRLLAANVMSEEELRAGVSECIYDVGMVMERFS